MKIKNRKDDLAMFIPPIFESSRQKMISSFYSQNDYIEYQFFFVSLVFLYSLSFIQFLISFLLNILPLIFFLYNCHIRMLQDMEIASPEKHMKQTYKGKGYALATVFVSDTLVISIDALICDAIFMGMVLDLSQTVVSLFSKNDMNMLVGLCPSFISLPSNVFFSFYLLYCLFFLSIVILK